MASGPSGKQPGRGSSPFAQVPKADIQRSTFDRSHSYKTTLDKAGLLYPIYVDEALPGDTFTLKLNAFARLATPIKPIMDNLHLETFFFAVPNRLIWDNWQKFNGEQRDPTDSTDYTIPQILFSDFEPQFGTIYDYMGVPLQWGSNAGDKSISAFWCRAYNLIYAEWFKDQNLVMVGPDLITDDGPDPETSYTLLSRGKRHDYFTSCMPWPQKALNATSSVGIPVVSTGGQPSISVTTNTNSARPLVMGTDGQSVAHSTAAQPVGDPIFWAPHTGLNAVADATGMEVLVNQMRQSVQVQKLLERDARGGTRYTEIIKAHFGVTSADQRLQRPEYLGGGYSPITINPVAQTTPSQETTGSVPEEDTPQGNLAALGTVQTAGHGFHKSFTEHCTLIGLVCIRADVTYQFGLDRMFSRKTRYDFYWPALSHIGEQAVMVSEVERLDANADTEVFGYQERYAEYRYKNSLITGQFRSNSVQSPAYGSLDLWHLGQDYATGTPRLNEDFIRENPPVDRVIAVPSEPHFLYDSFISLKCARPIPVFGTPGLVDHF